MYLVSRLSWCPSRRKHFGAVNWVSQNVKNNSQKFEEMTTRIIPSYKKRVSMENLWITITKLDMTTNRTILYTIQ